MPLEPSILEFCTLFSHSPGEQTFKPPQNHTDQKGSTLVLAKISQHVYCWYRKTTYLICGYIELNPLYGKVLCITSYLRALRREPWSIRSLLTLYMDPLYIYIYDSGVQSRPLFVSVRPSSAVPWRPVCPDRPPGVLAKRSIQVYSTSMGITG